VYAGLKRSSSVTAVDQADSDGVIPDPTKGVSVNKIKGVKAVGDIRNMLANLNSEKD
jgi:hypothetical protein